MRLLRTLKCILVPLGLLIVAVVGVLTAMADPPEPTSAPDVATDSANWEGARSDLLVQFALTDFDANERLSDNVYQQIVVAGWASKDLLAVIGNAQSDQTDGLEAINQNLQTLIKNQAALAQAAATTPPIDDRPRNLTLLAVLALCWLGAWSVVPTSPLARPEPALVVPQADRVPPEELLPTSTDVEAVDPTPPDDAA